MSLTTEQSAYLNHQMKKVSRSFALVVSYLEEPLRGQLATAYLICRVLDNIEDCEQPFEWQEKRFSEFSAVVNEPRLARETLSYWGQIPWPGLTADEKKLMGSEGGHVLWQIYEQMPEPARASINRWTSVMAGGMGQIENPDQGPRTHRYNGVQMLVDVEDYDRYCYYVAGTVGHMATELAIHHYQLNGKVAEDLLATCEACGRGLQKTNIVKDFAKDLRRGISYLPEQWLREVDYRPLTLGGASPLWSYKVIANVLSELREATDYVLALPYTALDYRQASLMCLLPAYQTLLLAAKKEERLFTADHQFKISRLTMAKCIRDSGSMIADNDAIRRYGQRLNDAIEEALIPLYESHPVAS
jgi:farnesyl-diphosphate farnesyltransferase